MHSAIARLSSKATEHAETLARHAQQLEAHGRILHTLTEQSAQHGAMLLKHAELHTSHAESIAAAREGARQAQQSTSDLGQEFRASMVSLSRYMSDTEKRRSVEVGELRDAIKAMAAAQQQMALQSVDTGNAMATLTRWQNHPILKVLGAIIGSAIAGYLAAKGH
jgi:hypothetical protein